MTNRRFTLIWLLLLAFLHLGFAICEVLPWSEPLLLRISLKKLELAQAPDPALHALLVIVVKNAGIYNLILSGFLAWTARQGEKGLPFAKVLCLGVAIAGAFGTATLQSPATAFQCLAGIATYVAIARKQDAERRARPLFD